VADGHPHTVVELHSHDRTRITAINIPAADAVVIARPSAVEAAAIYRALASVSMYTAGFYDVCRAGRLNSAGVRLDRPR